MATRTGGDEFRYGPGAQHIAKGHPAYGITTPHADFRCDFCEQRISGAAAHRTATGVVLCPDCLRYMKTLPQGAEAMLERFLTGNVI